MLHGVPASVCPLGFVILSYFLSLEYVKEIWKKNKTFEIFVTAQQAVSEDKAKDSPFFIIKKVNSTEKTLLLETLTPAVLRDSQLYEAQCR